jgi:hypothetical protein
LISIGDELLRIVKGEKDNIQIHKFFMILLNEAENLIKEIINENQPKMSGKEQHKN